ncbi:hypothetical protein KY342_00380 [Candidatus Woesearchaeota archaeon]|nr:hypothetical protein [Candidatus Woesearchaeota archaeon]
MNNSVEDEPPLLEKLANSLNNLKAVNPFVVIEPNRYDESVTVGLLLKDRITRDLKVHQVFRIYDPEEPVSERNVADNRRFIASDMKHPRCYRQIREFLEYLGYKNFHNSYLDYCEKRFRKTSE